MTFDTTISGWGGYPKQETNLLIPPSYSALQLEIQKNQSLISRGMGRSYGDSANASVVLQTNCFDHFIKFDTKEGLLTAEAGITLREILKVIVPQGWFLPVTPGTSFVTLGGAIASDVHGKNHHLSGTFGQYVKFLKVLLGTGDIVTASPSENKDLFRATCGGMGLTGVIVTATIQLIPIKSSFIYQKTIRTNCIETTMEELENNSNANYSVAWIDCLAKGKGLGRSLIMLGQHANNGGLDLNLKDPIVVPIYTPAVLLNSVTATMFNSVYWKNSKDYNIKKLPLMSYFYPLDLIGGWNKLYGKAGFIQYQFVLPKIDGISNMRKILTEIAKSGHGSFLAVIKHLGQANENLLSFPTEGYTLSLDFKMTTSIIKVLHKLDDTVADMGGRVYLSKDAVMREITFKSTYPKWQQFESIRKKYGAIGKFSSAQSKRLGLR